MRIQSIDFLRGIAIFLVLFRHVAYIPYLEQIGWIGVDLFFVISGFLVSGLLFNEFKKYNQINAKQFLIRRGFKIYPLFWFALATVIVSHNITNFGTETANIWAELFFYQNYHPGVISVTWSLAVEEHFYILLVLALVIGTRFGNLYNKKGFHYITGSVLVLCLGIRLINAVQYTEYNFLHHYSATHIRIDSLTFGVIIAYNYYFNKQWLTETVQKYSKQLLAIAVLCIAPCLILKTTNTFTFTFGFTFLYVGFGILLSLMVLHPKAEIKTQQLVTKTAYESIATVGTWSYALYLIHIPIHILFRRITERMVNMQVRDITMIVCYVTISIIAAYALTELIEKPFLKLRDKYFPKKNVIAKTRWMEALPI